MADFRLALPGIATLLLAACATTGPAADPKPSIPTPVAITLPPLSTPELEQGATVGYDGLLHKALPGEVYTDLFDRLRAGMGLGDIEEPRIDQQLNWYLRHPDYIERIFTRAAPYLHYIVTEIEARHLPLELAVLPVIESAFEPYAYSHARASGLWQFIPGTGTRFGLRQDWWYDGRRDVVSATRAALDYLEWLRDMFNGDWLLAIAAYNCGEMAVDRQVRVNESHGRPIDYWNLKLPKETQAYVPRLLAMARLVKDPGRYGLAFSEIPNEPFFQRVETGGQINMAVAAELAGLSDEELYGLNPAFHRFATPPNGPHFLLVPVESAATFRENLLQLTPDQRMRVERYEVRPKDTLALIARKFGTNAAVLGELNGLRPDAKLEPETELRIPSSVTALPPKVLEAAARVDGGHESLRKGQARHLHVVARGDSLSAIARKTGVPVATLASLNNLTASGTLQPGQKLKLPAETMVEVPATRKASAPTLETRKDRPGKAATYVVKAGDTLYSIARSLKVTVDALREWNRLGARDPIKPGQRLIASPRSGT
ncbi:MAG: hypothetical protein RLZZ200_27 [Pseudomonadota bacterium]